MFSIFLLFFYFSVPVVVFAAPQPVPNNTGNMSRQVGGLLPPGGLTGSGGSGGVGGIVGGSTGPVGSVTGALNGLTNGGTSGLAGVAGGAIAGATAGTLVEEVEGTVDHVENLAESVHVLGQGV